MTAGRSRHAQAGYELARRLGTTSRLTYGWRDSDRPASLRTHVARYGPAPAAVPGRTGWLIDVVTEAGLTGRGGAGFPSGVKMRSVARQRGPAVVVANGMESEPASDKDEALLSRAPHLVLDGVALAAAAVGADQVHLALPHDKRWLAAALRHAVTERTHARLDPVPIEVHGLPHGYVSSSESAVISWLNGGEAKPTAVPPRPFERGVDRRPTLISNVETFAHIALIARLGPRWFRRAGLPDAPGSMLTTIGGAVTAPGVHEIEAGTTIGELLELGGADRDASAVLIGGYFGTWSRIADAARLPLAKTALKRIDASPGAGVLLVLPAGTCGVIETARVLAWLASQSAGQCGPCMFGLPAIADDFAQLASCRPQGRVLDRLDRRLGVVTGRGACAHPDGTARLARSALYAFAADVHAHATGRPCLQARRARERGSSARVRMLPIPELAGTRSRP